MCKLPRLRGAINGKSKFKLTLGKYAVTGNRSSLSGTHEQTTLDPDLARKNTSSACSPEVQSMESGISSGFKI